MDNRLVLVLVAAVVYFAAMIGLGVWAQRTTSTTREDYFLAKRGLHGIVLFSAIFGTNITAFVMLGLPGVTYHAGIGLWPMLGGAITLIIPIGFYFGYRCWLVARKYGYITPVEFYRERFQSDALGLLMFVAFVVWTVPYILTGIIGGGRAFEAFTRGAVPFWAGALIVTAVVGYYTWAGGMKGTAWTNTAQVLLFMGFLVLAVVWVPLAAGGVDNIVAALQAEKPRLLTRTWQGPFGWGPAISQFYIFTFVVFSFPFVWIRFIAARSGQELRTTGIVYPLGYLLTWVPAILLGLWGAALVPGLQGAESDNIIFLVTGRLLPDWVAAVGLVALFAMVMSSMDAQILTLSNMFTLDVLRKYWPQVEAGRDVWFGRLFILVLLVLMYAVSFAPLPRLFDIATFAFTGFATFFPVLIGSLFWRRANKWGAISSLVVGQVVAFAGFFELYPSIAGLQPAFWVAVLGWATFIVVSLLTPAQPEAAQRFHSVWDDVWRRSPPPGWKVERPAEAVPPRELTA